MSPRRAGSTSVVQPAGPEPVHRRTPVRPVVALVESEETVYGATSRPVLWRERMKAAVYVGDPKSLAIEELKPNPPGPRDVVLEIGASGVCHSDLSVMRGYVPVPPGMVLGHEGAGRVVEVGAEVSRVKMGDRVIASFVPACGTCWHCLREQSELCDRENELAMQMRGSRPDGGSYFCMTGSGPSPTS